ncbi:MAG: lycopene cyclase domain-containing protein [Trueperaceae bacterium]
MTYLQFHLVFLLPPILLLAWAAWRDRGSWAGTLAATGAPARWALGTIVLLALLWTTPWDNYLVYREVWGYPPGRVLATIGYVPVEEYAFFLLQPILTGLFLFHLARRDARRGAGPAQVPHATGVAVRTVSTAFWLAVAAAGAGMIVAGASWTYLGLILAWAAPIAALQTAVAGHRLWAWRRLAATSIVVPTAYLWIADRIAIGAGIWWISEPLTTGVHLVGLPIEEATFFLMTNLIVAQGLVAFLDMGPDLIRRLRARWLRRAADGDPHAAPHATP